MRVLLGAFGDPGHAFPMIALGRALVARGHEVTLQTWTRWQGHVEAEGISFAAAPEYHVFPSGPEPLNFYEAVVHATNDTLPLVRELRPDVAVADILTLAPALAAEPRACPAQLSSLTSIPTAGRSSRSTRSALACREAASAALFGATRRVRRQGSGVGAVELDHTRVRLGLRPLGHVHGGISRELALVGTFPQLEYPRAWPANVHVVGPLMWEPPAAEWQLPPGDAPLVLVAPSTAQDPHHRMLTAALRGLAEAPTCACSPPGNRRLPSRRCPCPRTRASSTGSPTPARCPVAMSSSATPDTARSARSLIGLRRRRLPEVGDMNENAARLDWAGAGVRVPRRFVSPRAAAAGGGTRAGRAIDPRPRARARRVGGAHDPGAAAAKLVEQLAA